jgi:FRG domain
MNLISIETEEEFAQFVNEPPLNVTYRGQRNASWKLESTLERAAKEKFGDAFRQFLHHFEISIIDQFVERCTRLKLGDIYCPKNPNNTKNGLPDYSDTYQWLSLLQHYGYPTRLIDFTDDLWVALFFALEHLEPNVPFAIYTLPILVSNKLPKDSNGNPYQFVDKGKIVFNVNELLGLIINFSHFYSPYGARSLTPDWNNPKQNYGWDEPAIKNTRIERQDGKFLYQLWLDDQIEKISELTKYTIAAKFRNAAIRMLQDKGIKYTREYLFPAFDQS